MYHSIQIIPDNYAIYKNAGDLQRRTYRGRNTWDDWHLIPKERPLFNPPSPKYNFMDIPGANGTVDLSDVLSDKYPVYNDRTGSIEFYVMNGYKEWYEAYSDIMNFCHGEKCKLILEDDPLYYYRGRVSVNAWKSEKDWSKIVLDYQVEPFKFELYGSTDPWFWDPFNFTNGIVVNNAVWDNGIVVGDEKDNQGNVIVEHPLQEDVKVGVERMPVCPEFSLQCLTPVISSDSKLTIQLLREFGNENSPQQFLMTTHTWLAPSDDKEYPNPHNVHNVSFYDIVLINYAHRFSRDVTNDRCNMILRFIAPETESFRIGASFRRGKL